AALEPSGFIHQEVFGVEMFLDGPQANPRDAVHLLFAAEPVKADDLAPAPDVSESERSQPGYLVVTVEALVRMKLTSFHDKDRTHLRDMTGVGLTDATWPARPPPALAARLQELLDNPDG